MMFTHHNSKYEVYYIIGLNILFVYLYDLAYPKGTNRANKSQ